MTTPPTQPTPLREVRAVFDEHTLTVYQAYSAAIADPALAAGTFVPPFKRDRMTWVKPSFRWMMYRCGWARKPGQERVLAVRIRRAGFEWALAHAALSHFDPAVHASREEWANRKSAPVRVQWDPERSLSLDPLRHRAIQVGIGGAAVPRYVNDWIVGLTDVTDLAHEVHGLVEGGELAAAADRLPLERPYPLPTAIKEVVGAS